MVGDNLPSPGRNRVNWLAKYWGGGQWHPWHPRYRHHCLLSSFHKLRKYFEISRYLIFSLSLELHTLLQLLAKMSHNYRLLSLVYAIDNNSFLRNSWYHLIEAWEYRVGIIPDKRPRCEPDNHANSTCWEVISLTLLGLGLIKINDVSANSERT